MNGLMRRIERHFGLDGYGFEVRIVHAGSGRRVAAGDLLRVALRPSPARPAAFRWFALAVPALLHVAYFAALAVTVGIGYSPHLWMGVVVFAGVVGWLLSYLVLPPRGAAGREAAPA